ncbi:hypothetical protein CBF92_05860 [Limosilactobacillus reuteri]|nr:hypothetical protein CBF92_05860 [Limosilactobacillus reuteri]
MNMTKAATKLHVAQPSISRSIRELENELGVSLFIRQGKKLILTAQGNYFFTVVNRSFNQLRLAKENVKAIHSLNNKKITIKMCETTPLLVSFLKIIHNKYPQINLQFIQSKIDNDPRHYDFQLVPLPVPEQHNELLLSEEVFLATSKENSQSTFQLEKINQLPLIEMNESPFADFIQRFLSAQRIDPQVVLRTGDRNLMINLVAQGYASCFVPELSWNSTANLEKISLHKIGKNGFHRRIYLSYPYGPRTSIQEQVATLLLNYSHSLKKT